MLGNQGRFDGRVECIQAELVELYVDIVPIVPRSHRSVGGRGQWFHDRENGLQNRLLECPSTHQVSGYKAENLNHSDKQFEAASQKLEITAVEV